MNHTKALKLVLKDLKARGFQAAGQDYEEAKGTDIHLFTGKKSYKVEVKVAYRLKNGGWQVNPVRKEVADMVAIVYPDKTVMYSTIEDHNALASQKGYRGLSKYANFFMGL